VFIDFRLFQRYIFKTIHNELTLEAATKLTVSDYFKDTFLKQFITPSAFTAIKSL